MTDGILHIMSCFMILALCQSNPDASEHAEVLEPTSFFILPQAASFRAARKGFGV